MRANLHAALLLAPLALGGCGVHHVVPYARVAFEATAEPGTVLALPPSSCSSSLAGAPEGQASCGRNRDIGVDELVRATLEFAGHQVVDSERIEPTVTLPGDVWKYEDEEEGSRVFVMDDLTPTHRRALVALGVEGVLSTAVVSGPQWVEVQIQMTRMDSGARVWRSHCRAMVNEGARVVQTTARALQAATSCAIEAPGALRRASRGQR